MKIKFNELETGKWYPIGNSLHSIPEGVFFLVAAGKVYSPGASEFTLACRKGDTWLVHSSGGSYMGAKYFMRVPEVPNEKHKTRDSLREKIIASRRDPYLTHLSDEKFADVVLEYLAEYVRDQELRKTA